jgi:hypothetical protein
MNHSLEKILPFEKMPEDVRSGDIVTIFFPHTKITGHIRDNAPWSSSYKSVYFEEDDFLLSLHSNEGDSEDLPFNLPCYGINCSEGTLTQKVKDYYPDAGELIKIKAVGYSIVQRQWDWRIEGFIPGKVHCGGLNGYYPLEGETDSGIKIKGLMRAKYNGGPIGGVLMYADPSEAYINKAIRLKSFKGETLEREYQGNEIFLIPQKALNKNNVDIDSGQAIMMPFTDESLESIINKKIDVILSDKLQIINLVNI